MTGVTALTGIPMVIGIAGSNGILLVDDANATVVTPGTLYLFRYRTLSRNVLGDWSDAVTFRVT